MGCVKSPKSFILFLLNSDIKFDSLDYLDLIDRRTVPVPCPCAMQFTTDVFFGVWWCKQQEPALKWKRRKKSNRQKQKKKDGSDQNTNGMG